MEHDLTRGNVLKTIAVFALPYMLSYFLQMLYGMADLYMMGQFSGAAGITAVGNGAQTLYIITVTLVGLAMGTTVIVGHAVGSRRFDRAETAIGNTITLFMGVSVVLAAVLLALCPQIVALIGTPAEAVEGIAAYLRICFVGIPFIAAYNILSAIFRGLGDSRSPMYVIGVACIINIALDFLFIGHMGLGPVGAALGTVIAQTASVALALVWLKSRRTNIHVKRSDLRPQPEVLGSILKIGVPVAVQDGCIQVAFMFITVIANRRGLTDAAAVGIVEKIISFLFLVPSSMLSTVSALGAQCIGAGKPRRALQTLWYAIAVAFGFGVLITIVIQFVAEPVVGLFTDSAAVAAAGGQYLRGYILDCCFAGLHFCFSGYFCAIGRSELSFLHNITAVVFVRVPGAYLMSKWFPTTLLPMGLATAVGSLLSVIICVIAFLVLRRRGRLVPEEA